MAIYTKLQRTLLLTTIISTTFAPFVSAHADTSQEATLKALNKQMIEMNKQIMALKKEVTTLRSQQKNLKANQTASRNTKSKKMVAQRAPETEPTPLVSHTTTSSGQPDPKMINVASQADDAHRNQKSVIELLHNDGLPPPDRGASFWSPNMPLFSSATKHDETVYVGGIRIGFPGGRPTIATDDGRYSFSIGLALQEDIGSYINSGNRRGETKGRFSQFRETLRRARIPFTFRYTDFAVNITPDFGGGSAGLYEANMQYGGLKNTILTFGFFEPRVTLEGSESSNEGALMERPAAVELARGIAAGDSRFSIGGVTYGKRWYVGSYFTGHTYSATKDNPDIIKDQTGGMLRVAGRPYASKDIDLHLGLSASSAFNVAQTNKGKQYNFSGSPGFRLTQETLIRTGALDNVSNVWEAGPELAFRWNRFLAKGEYIQYGINRSGGQRSLNFDGYYTSLTYTILGKPRSYDIRSAAFRSPAVEYDFDPKQNHWGAVEISGRWSVLDLNSHKNASDGVQGGKQTVWTGGVNWYPNPHFRVSLNYDHVMTSSTPNNPLNIRGRNLDAVAARFQAAF
ncbi:porin [Commensalibacter communis]|uniref:porin n=1 Tax=Commensalibacter communis TaxID=2972786 RepID=UPI0022FFB051|nr:porin [Commensalibacter communis]CAI3958026.1 Phosphate-selective porin (OprP) (PDB:2O4V) [Commensalibacter communis]CAI3958419.1 Phosphate-selective porin (OprP) (PDB:2O4V) [Commensalibacter communis]